MPPGEAHDVVVVGAGAAGLSTAAALGRRGIGAVVLDRDDRIGGTWSRRYARLRLHTVRRFSGLAHHPIPRRYPRYLTKDDYAEYLRDYAARLCLDVRLGEEVRRIGPLDGGPEWRLATGRGDRFARVVVVATGHHAEPLLPDWPGAAGFRGELLHSAAYDSGERFAGRSVLVVGIGNSGAEIATDLVEAGAARVSVAVRTAPPVMPRDLFGIVPAQLFGIALAWVPAPGLLDRLGALLRRAGAGDVARHGLGPAAWGPFAARRPAVIDVGFLRALRAGRIRVRPALAALSPDGAVFADGSEEAVHAVVAATGFRTGLERLLDVPGAVRADGELHVRSGRATPYPGLYVTGFEETMRGHLFEASRESRRLAREIARYLGARPSKSAR